MSVAITVKYYLFQIGTSDFLHSFFSTVAYNLEDGIWGSKYPFLMKELYSGRLNNKNVGLAMEELVIIKEKLSGISVKNVVWDIEDLSKQPPWGDNISVDITDLSNYFVTSEGEDLITVIIHAFEKAISLGEDVLIITI